MASRPVWKGYLKLSLVSVPVKAFTASKSSTEDIHLNQLHEECHSRIRYKKTCPVHGEVPNDEIISGYEVAKDQYVPVEPDELRAIRRKSDQSLEIDTFISPDELDERFQSGRSYYLVPDGKIAHKPYALIHATLQNEHLRAIGEIILSNREQLVLLRPLDKLLMITVLQHASEMKEPAEFSDDVPAIEVGKPELQLTKQLVAALTKTKWDYTQYTDHYQERLSELIATKMEGRQLVTSEEEDVPEVINLMDALKASIEQIPVPEGASKRKTSRAKASGSTASATKSKPKPSRIAAASSAETTSKSKPRRSRQRKTG